MSGEKKYEILLPAAGKMTKMVLLTNAGGAAATIGVLTATAQGGSVNNLFALPLGLFCGGAILAMAYGIIHVLGLAEELGEHTAMPRITGRNWLFVWTGVGAAICFIAGAGAGVALTAII